MFLYSMRPYVIVGCVRLPRVPVLVKPSHTDYELEDLCELFNHATKLSYYRGTFTVLMIFSSFSILKV